MPDLFSPYTLKGVTLRNRIAMSPMTMYNSVDGKLDDYHVSYLGARAAGGFGLVFGEQMAITPDGRTTTSCAGIWDDDQIEGHARVCAIVERMGGVPAIQLGHTGRKGSELPPHKGTNEQGTWKQLPPDHEHGWECVAPSAIPYGGGGHIYPGARAVGRGHQGPAPVLCRRGAARARGRLQVAGDALCARLSRRELLLAARQPAHRPVRRLGREPRALPPRSAGRRAGRVAGGIPADDAARLRRPPTRAACSSRMRSSAIRMMKEHGLDLADLSARLQHRRHDRTRR